MLIEIHFPFAAHRSLSLQNVHGDDDGASAVVAVVVAVDLVA